MERSAGMVTSVNTRMARIPIIVKFTRSAIGAISENENDSNPATVVKLVMVIGKPECFMVATRPRNFPTRFWYL